MRGAGAGRAAPSAGTGPRPAGPSRAELNRAEPSWAKPGRAKPGRAAPPPNGGRVLPGGPGSSERSGVGRFPAAELGRAASGLPTWPSQRAAGLAGPRASSSPGSPVGQDLERQVEAEPGESRGFPCWRAARWPLSGRAAAAPEDGKQCQGSGSSRLAPALLPGLGWSLRSASCRCFRQSLRVLGRSKGQVAPISSLNQLPVSGTVCVKEEHPGTLNQDELLLGSMQASPLRTSSTHGRAIFSLKSLLLKMCKGSGNVSCK